MIVLITPTGCRKDQFNICQQLMKKQTYTGEVVWIIVDDFEPRTTDMVTEDFRPNWTIIKEYPQPFWQLGYNTQGRNISVGINALDRYKSEEIEGIFIIEDDDYYKPEYLDEMVKRLPGYLLIGETNTIYYNVAFRRYALNANKAHASLFQIAFKPELIPYLRKIYTEKFIDFVFFDIVRRAGLNDKINLFFANYLAVGMKGMPGRSGIGAGHSRAFSMNVDSGMNYLNQLIGTADAQLYSKFYLGANNRDNNMPQQRIFSRKGI